MKYLGMMKKIDDLILTVPGIPENNRLDLYVTSKMLWLGETNNPYITQYNAFALGRELLKGQEVGEGVASCMGAMRFPKEFWEKVHEAPMKTPGEQIAEGARKELIELKDDMNLDQMEWVIDHRNEAGVEAARIGIGIAVTQNNLEMIKQGIDIMSIIMPVRDPTYVEKTLHWQRRYEAKKKESIKKRSA